MPRKLEHRFKVGDVVQVSHHSSVAPDQICKISAIRPDTGWCVVVTRGAAIAMHPNQLTLVVGAIDVIDGQAVYER